MPIPTSSAGNGSMKQTPKARNSEVCLQYALKASIRSIEYDPRCAMWSSWTLAIACLNALLIPRERRRRIIIGILDWAKWLKIGVFVTWVFGTPIIEFGLVHVEAPAEYQI